MPIQQWLYFDAIECLPDNSLEVLTEDECQPVCNSFYYIICCNIDASNDSTVKVIRTGCLDYVVDCCNTGTDATDDTAVTVIRTGCFDYIVI